MWLLYEVFLIDLPTSMISDPIISIVIESYLTCIKKGMIRSRALKIEKYLCKLIKYFKEYSLGDETLLAL